MEALSRASVRTFCRRSATRGIAPAAARCWRRAVTASTTRRTCAVDKDASCFEDHTAGWTTNWELPCNNRLCRCACHVQLALSASDFHTAVSAPGMVKVEPSQMKASQRQMHNTFDICPMTMAAAAGAHPQGRLEQRQHSGGGSMAAVCAAVRQTRQRPRQQLLNRKQALGSAGARQSHQVAPRLCRLPASSGSF